MELGGGAFPETPDQGIGETHIGALAVEMLEDAGGYTNMRKEPASPPRTEALLDVASTTPDLLSGWSAR